MNIMIDALHRDPLSKTSPVEFSFKFLLGDNIARLTLTFTSCIVAVMAGPAFVQFIGIYIPVILAKYTPLILGLTSDIWPMMLKKYFEKS
jgi:hypothetical protein